MRRRLLLRAADLVLAIGIAALFVPCGHYFQLNLTRWIFGDRDYFKAVNMGDCWARTASTCGAWRA